MRIAEVARDEWNAEHVERHGVEPGEVEEALVARGTRVWRGRGGTYYALGRTAPGRYLFVVFALRGPGRAYPISARDMTEREKRRFRRRR